MKFSNYQRAVNPNTINAQVRPVTDENAYGSGGKEWNALGAAIGQINKVAIKQRDDQDAENLQAARNDVMQQLNEKLHGENGIFTLGLGTNADGMTDRTNQAIDQTIDDVSKNYNRRVAYALKNSLNDNMNAIRNSAMSQENRERTGVEDANYTSGLAMNAQNAAIAWDVRNALTNYNKDTERQVYASAVKRGWTGLQVQTELRKALTQNISGAVQAAITNGDYDRGDEILRYNRQHMDQAEYLRLAGAIKQKKTVKETYSTAENIFNQCWDPKTGRFNYDLAKKLIKQSSYSQIGGGNFGSDKEAFFNAIEQQETSGTGTNKTTSPLGARGVYQIMPENWPEWAKQAGYPGGDMNDDATYRAVGRFKMGQYFDQYGPEGALVAWYSGPANADRWVAGEETDVYGRPWDAPQDSGPSIKGYVESAMSKYHPGGGGGNAAGVTPYHMGVQSGIDSQLESLKPSWKDGVLDTIGGVLKDKFGTIGEISSGARSESHNAEVGGSPTSHHIDHGDGGDAVDIVLDGNANAEEIKNYFESSGAFQEVLFHDAGSGLHLHLGGYNGGFGSGGSSGGGRSSYDVEKEKSLMQALEARLADATREFKMNHSNHIEDVSSAIDNSHSFSEASQLIEGDTSLTLQEKNTLKGLAASKFDVHKDGSAITHRTGGSGSGKASAGGAVGQITGTHYSAKQIWDAQYNLDEYNRRKNEPGEFTDAETKKFTYAAHVINDINGTGTGPDTDNLNEPAAYTVAQEALENTGDHDAAVQELMEKYDFSEGEAETYVSEVENS